MAKIKIYLSGTEKPSDEKGIELIPVDENHYAQINAIERLISALEKMRHGR